MLRRCLSNDVLTSKGILANAAPVSFVWHPLFCLSHANLAHHYRCNGNVRLLDLRIHLRELLLHEPFDWSVARTRHLQRRDKRYTEGRGRGKSGHRTPFSYSLHILSNTFSTTEHSTARLDLVKGVHASNWKARQQAVGRA